MGTHRSGSALTVAATEMANLFGSSHQSAGPDSAGGHFKFVLSKHGVSDEHVTPFTVRHGAEDISTQFPKLLSRLERRLFPTHLGVGSHHGPRGWTTTVLVAHRGIDLERPFLLVGHPRKRYALMDTYAVVIFGLEFSFHHRRPGMFENWMCRRKTGTSRLT